MFKISSRVHPDTKRWDKIVICFLFVAILAIPLVAGLDDGRFHLSSMSWWVVTLGYLVQLAGWIGVAWAETVNQFFEPGVHIQTERGHHVIDTGPYTLYSAPRLFRCSSHLRRHRIVAGLLVGVDSCGFWFAVALLWELFGKTEHCKRNCLDTQSTHSVFASDWFRVCGDFDQEQGAGNPVQVSGSMPAPVTAMA